MRQHQKGKYSNLYEAKMQYLDSLQWAPVKSEWDTSTAKEEIRKQNSWIRLVKLSYHLTFTCDWYHNSFSVPYMRENYIVS